ncbi:unnamed protein product [Vitrella brassicaformis CCMP3155]|uniref:Uncharacterized protein n=1 Tax=Vitrella brassicaformis (strain CCMP3155) TaxID=1169540 RepID=A0A0G4FHY0_VITBC|nr:unnamed protein product [Vitrella brassicaformis CCMP3155]|eukprot:CEM12931.1 unnamed protein product [Vitrella brassicaformis CCMP3155]
MVLVGLGSLCTPPLWWGILCIIYFFFVLAIVLSGSIFSTAVYVSLKPDPFGPGRFGTLAWVAGAVSLQLALFIVLSEPRIVRASTSPTGERKLDVDHNRLSCCGRRAEWRPSPTAERIAKARQIEPILYHSVVKRRLKRMDILTFVRFYKLVAVVGMAMDFITDAAVGLEFIRWSMVDTAWRRARSICGVPPIGSPWDDADEECFDTTRSRLEEEAQGHQTVGLIILGLSLADVVSLFLHYSIRGSPSLC